MGAEQRAGPRRDPAANPVHLAIQSVWVEVRRAESPRAIRKRGWSDWQRKLRPATL